MHETKKIVIIKLYGGGGIPEIRKIREREREGINLKQ